MRDSEAVGAYVLRNSLLLQIFNNYLSKRLFQNNSQIIQIRRTIDIDKNLRPAREMLCIANEKCMREPENPYLNAYQSGEHLIGIYSNLEHTNLEHIPKRCPPDQNAYQSGALQVSIYSNSELPQIRMCSNMVESRLELILIERGVYAKGYYPILGNKISGQFGMNLRQKGHLQSQSMAQQISSVNDVLSSWIQINLKMEEAKRGAIMTAESLVGRFRSKEDLHKYLSQHCNIFLPSLKGTTVAFLRDVLNDTKSHLKTNEVVHLQIPFYQEISVSNMYRDAMQDEQLKKYLPGLDQLSNRLPERRFFFGVLSTLKRQYLLDVITAAHNHRYKAESGDGKRQGIAVSEHWEQELVKHPFFSRKRGTAIFLMKEGAKVRKGATQRKQFQVVKRLSSQISGGLDSEMAQPKAEKRLKYPPPASQAVSSHTK